MKSREFPPIISGLSFGAIVVTDILGTPWATIAGAAGIIASFFWKIR